MSFYSLLSKYIGIYADDDERPSTSLIVQGGDHLCQRCTKQYWNSTRTLASNQQL